tara:strand:+ start:279 stop:755 length:477 start_codon:yes stop_codon:yes gene_type:complete
MRFAREEDSQEIYELYQKNRKFFPNITIGHISNRIKKRECIYTEGVVIIFRIHQKTVQIGENTQSKMSDCVLNQIVTSFLNGSASRVLNRFFDYIGSLPHASGVIHLSVRSDNDRAKKFFERNEMELVDKTSLDKGKIEVDVYMKMVKGDSDMFFTPP